MMLIRYLSGRVDLTSTVQAQATTLGWVVGEGLSSEELEFTSVLLDAATERREGSLIVPAGLLVDYGARRISRAVVCAHCSERISVWQLYDHTWSCQGEEKNG